MEFTAPSISLHTLPAGIQHFNLDLPNAGISYNGHELNIAGWAYAHPPLAVRSIEIMDRGNLVKWAPLTIPRPDVSSYLGITEGHERKFGFHTWIGTLGLSDTPQLDIILNVVDTQSQQRTKIKAASIHGKKQPKLTTSSKYQPALITAIGRSGTTLAMEVLTAHPQVLTSNFYPYELRQAAYWLSVLKILNDPADFHKSSHPDAFEQNINLVGHNPFKHPDFVQQLGKPELFLNYYSEKLPAELIRFVIDRIDEYYELIAQCEEKFDARFFAEKAVPTQIQSICQDIFTHPKEIILTRDFRDIICSARSFNAKRNSQGFGRAAATDDLDWIQTTFKHGAKNLADAWRSRSATALHVRYEDLILAPAKQITRILEHLDVDRSSELVTSIAGKIFAPASHPQHITANSPEHSISRWKKDLPPSLLEQCNFTLAEELRLFGYL